MATAISTRPRIVAAAVRAAAVLSVVLGLAIAPAARAQLGIDL
jgi:hypothetical protein